MWVSSGLLDLFGINKETVEGLRLDNAALRSKNEIIERELSTTKIMADFLRHQVNGLQAERAILLSKAYPGLNLPVPEIARIDNRLKEAFNLTDLFAELPEDPTAN